MMDTEMDALIFGFGQAFAVPDLVSKLIERKYTLLYF